MEVKLPENIDNSVHTDAHLKNHFDVTVQMFGDKSTLTEVCFLIAYIRDMIMNGRSGDIKVEVGKHVSSDFFGFTVNGEPMAKVIAQPTISVN